MTSRRELFDERVARSARRSSVGFLGGRSEQAQAPGVRVITPQITTPRWEIITYTPPTLSVATSPKYRVMLGGRLTIVTFEAVGVGTGNTVWRIILNGTAISPSLTESSATLSTDHSMNGNQVDAGANVRIDVTTAGGHTMPTFQVIMAR